jgi:hypothetical protein
MCKEMLVIPVDRAVDKKRVIRKNEGPRRRRGTRGTHICTYIHVNFWGDHFSLCTYVYDKSD